MYRIAVLLGLAVVMMLPACAMWDSGRDEEPQAVGMAPGQGIERQQDAAGQEAKETQEFMGVAPKVEDLEESIVLKAKNGDVPFSHRKHAELLGCAACHEGTPGEIPGFDKNKAHALCTGCHKEQNAGPTKCSECHKKS